MLSNYEQKIDEMKESLIYAVNEHYEGELKIEDVTDSLYSKMVLEQDKKVIDNSSYFYAEAASELIEVLEKYCNSIKKSNKKTIFRNSEVVEETLNDLCQIIMVLILSIRKNNSDWQAKLSECVHKKKDSTSKKDFTDFGCKLAELIKDYEASFKGDEEDDKK